MIKEYSNEIGIKIPAVTAAEMIEIDRLAIEETGPNLFQMMGNAGRNLAELTIKAMGYDSNQQSIVVLAGTGGNGGGGLCTARNLANKGYQVKVCLTESNKLKDVPKYQLHILKSTSAKIISIEDLQNEKPDLIIDAIIGYSLKGAPNGMALEFIEWAERQLCIMISLGVPSGIDATSGEHSEYFIKPDLTLTLALPKTGLLPEITGELFLGDIGIPRIVFQKIGIYIPSSIFSNQWIIRLTGNIKRY